MKHIHNKKLLLLKGFRVHNHFFHSHPFHFYYILYFQSICWTEKRRKIALKFGTCHKGKKKKFYMCSLPFNALLGIFYIFKVKLIDKKRNMYLCVYVGTSKSVRFCYPLVSYLLFNEMLVPHFLLFFFLSSLLSRTKKLE